MSGSDRADAIKYYVRQYPGETTDGTIFGAYGPRLRPQVSDVIKQLTGKPSSKRAVVALFDRDDNNRLSDVSPAQENEKIQPPCTCTLQFLNRDGALQMITHMRSNDAVWGLTHDVFCFTLLQEYVARSLGVPLGSYTHVAGSLHVYDDKRAEAEAFLSEGAQQTTTKMPPMPLGSPHDGLEQLLAAEVAIRSGHSPAEYPLDPYWADLAHLLEVFSVAQKRVPADLHQQLRTLADQMQHAEYRGFIIQRLDSKPNL